MTFNYINLTLRHPDNFKSILAVTFTNKATEEMKSRILSTLTELSVGKHAMSEDLMTALNISEQELLKRSHALIRNILHNYSSFAVTTIDAFFQKVVKSFAREIGVQSGINIEMDQKKVISEVVDKLLMNLQGNDQLIKWLTAFSIDKLNAGKSWDTKNAIKSLSAELFKEKVVLYKAKMFAKTSDPKFMQSFANDMFNGQEKLIKGYQAIAKEVFKICENNGFHPLDFTYGNSGVGGYIMKVIGGEFKEPGTRVRSAIDDEKWFSAKSAHKSSLAAAISDGLVIQVDEMTDYYESNVKKYHTISQVSTYLYTFGVLSYVNEQINEYREENEVLLISDFATFLNEIIRDSDTPFIYEKIGTRFKHFLIDEFQDTSGIQWSNFKPLIQDSLSAGNQNMAVGDVKQSIYRWRGGNWRILMEKMQSEIGSEYIQEKNLTVNRRSKKNIIDFNNALFNFAAASIQSSLQTDKNDIEKAYSDSQQLSHDNSDEGLIQIVFNKYEDKDENEEMVMEQLIGQIQQLQDNGYEPKDIAILVKKNREGQVIAQALMEYAQSHVEDNYCYDFISNESLFLKNNFAVNTLLQGFHFLLFPQEKIYEENLRYAYGFHYDKIATEIVDEKIKRMTAFSLEKQPPSLTEAVDFILDIFRLYDKSKHAPYLMAFQDSILDYLQYGSNSIQGFLEWWEDQSMRSLQSSGDENAISILTIHKSKGLQFKSVIVPFCNWIKGNSRKDTLIWCDTQDHEMFKGLPLFPLNSKKAMELTDFSDEYHQEMSEIHLDNLNVLYVALTRAEEALLLTCSINTANKSANTVAHTIFEYAQINDLVSETFDDIATCTVGSMVDQQEESDRESTDDIETLELEFGNPSTTALDRIEIKNKAQWISNDQIESINYGNVVHWIFSNIKFKNDFLPAIEDACVRYSLKEKEVENIKQEIKKIWEIPEVSYWFKDIWQVKNEASILLENGKTKRPDRVIVNDNQAKIIDYKMGKPSENHINQVSEYKQLLSDMGYEQVDGYLLYLTESKVVRI